MIDHLGLIVSDYLASRDFYAAALAPLGYSLMMEPAPAVGGFGRDKPEFWIGAGGPPQSGVHVAFVAADRAAVDAFYAAALTAGGRDNGAPGPRPMYHEHHYGAYVLDPDGYMQTSNLDAALRRMGLSRTASLRPRPR
jgi:catechol 2,3-dioxygenase-like lactoylglutathione lyase family enzyme